MSKLIWDQTSERFYETGVDHGILFPTTAAGGYDKGVAWSGLTSVNESPEGAEANDIYADNIKYLSLISAENYKFSIGAYTYPNEFEECDGSRELTPGVRIGQQPRKPFGFAFRSIKGNDTQGDALGYIYTLIYGCKASVSERDHQTTNDSPEAAELSWDCSTTPVTVGTINGVEYKPTATVKVDTTMFTTAEAKAKLQAFIDKLEGTADTEPTLPTPAEVYALFTSTNPSTQGVA